MLGVGQAEQQGMPASRARKQPNRAALWKPARSRPSRRRAFERKPNKEQKTHTRNAQTLHIATTAWEPPCRRGQLQGEWKRSSAAPLPGDFYQNNPGDGSQVFRRGYPVLAAFHDDRKRDTSPAP